MIQPRPPQAAHAATAIATATSTLAIWGKGIRCTNSTEMQILTVDVGTGTQDVLLFDSERELENCFKLVLPSPTVVIADRVRAATATRRRVVLSGVTMGGGPSHWATMDHVRAGLEAFATPDAARTFDDDLNAVAEMGITVVSDDEALGLA